MNIKIASLYSYKVKPSFNDHKFVLNQMNLHCAIIIITTEITKIETK